MLTSWVKAHPLDWWGEEGEELKSDNPSARGTGNSDTAEGSVRAGPTQDSLFCRFQELLIVQSLSFLTSS